LKGEAGVKEKRIGVDSSFIGIFGLQLLFYGFEKANLVCPFSQMLC
jgi:hypothetical protein